MIKQKWNLVAFLFAVSAFLAAFGITLAATVQVSREVPSTLTVAEVTVIADDNLFLSHDREGNEEVTSLEFQMLNLQPPLEQFVTEHEIYVRNDSGQDLILTRLCDEFNDTDTGIRLGEIKANFFDPDTEEFLDDGCRDDGTPLAMGEVLLMGIHTFDMEDLAEGEYTFNFVVGAFGEE